MSPFLGHRQEVCLLNVFDNEILKSNSIETHCKKMHQQSYQKISRGHKLSGLINLEIICGQTQNLIALLCCESLGVSVNT